MNAHRQHQMDRDTVERLLDGPAADPRDAPEGLVLLLAAVRAAPRPQELRGEGSAVRAFHAARLDPAPTRRPVRQGVLGWLLTAKAAVAALAVAATGGVALAAVQGSIPNPLRPAPAVTSSAPGDGPAGTGPATDPAGPDGRPGEPGGPAATPTLAELCRLYRDERGDAPDRVLRDPAFRKLVDSAGGRERVDGYCDDVLARQPSGTPGGGPTDRPGGGKTPRPSGGPDLPASPSVRPTPPGGRPSAPTTVPPSLPGAPQVGVQLPRTPDVVPSVRSS